MCAHALSGSGLQGQLCRVFRATQGGRGYFNFEFNCGGALLFFYIVDPTRVPGGFREFTRIPEADGKQVAIYHSLPQVVDPEIVEATEWRLEFFIPFALLEKYAGAIGNAQSQAAGRLLARTFPSAAGGRNQR